jgi:hypothetical protein
MNNMLVFVLSLFRVGSGLDCVRADDFVCLELSLVFVVVVVVVLLAGSSQTIICFHPTQPQILLLIELLALATTM